MSIINDDVPTILLIAGQSLLIIEKGRHGKDGNGRRLYGIACTFAHEDR